MYGHDGKIYVCSVHDATKQVNIVKFVLFLCIDGIHSMKSQGSISQNFERH